MSSCEADLPSHCNFGFRPPLIGLRNPPTRKYFNANMPSRLRSGPPQPRQSTCSRRSWFGGASTRTSSYSASHVGHWNLVSFNMTELQRDDGFCIVFTLFFRRSSEVENVRRLHTFPQSNDTAMPSLHRTNETEWPRVSVRAVQADRDLLRCIGCLAIF